MIAGEPFFGRQRTVLPSAASIGAAVRCRFRRLFRLTRSTPCGLKAAPATGRPVVSPPSKKAVWERTGIKKASCLSACKKGAALGRMIFPLPAFSQSAFLEGARGRYSLRSKNTSPALFKYQIPTPLSPQARFSASFPTFRVCRRYTWRWRTTPSPWDSSGPRKCGCR